MSNSCIQMKSKSSHHKLHQLMKFPFYFTREKAQTKGEQDNVGESLEDVEIKGTCGISIMYEERLFDHVSHTHNHGKICTIHYNDL